MFWFKILGFGYEIFWEFKVMYLLWNKFFIEAQAHLIFSACALYVLLKLIDRWYVEKERVMVYGD